MLLTQKIRIFPTKEQIEVLWALSEKCRLIYNFFLQDRRTNWVKQQKKLKKDRKYLTYNEQSAKLKGVKQVYPEYKWVYSKVLQQTVKKLDENFKSFFGKLKQNDPTAKPPRFRGKKYFVTLCFNQSGFRFSNGSIIFSHKHPSNIALEFKPKYSFRIEGNVKQVEILYDDNKRWFISIVYNREVPKYSDNGLYQAIDLGISQLVSVNLEFKFLQIKNRRADLYFKKKFKEVHSKRDHCKKGSHRWVQYNKALVKTKRKYANQMRDYQHKISNQVVSNTKANTIIIGNLNVKQMAKHKKGTGVKKKTKFNKTLNHSIHNTGSLSRFSQFLTYKAELIGKKVIRIDESYTSQLCCVCCKKRKRGLHERTIICNCGNNMDRDNNSAVNIMERFLSLKHKYPFLLQQPSMKEVSFHKRLDMLRKTALSPQQVGDGGLVVMGTHTKENIELVS